MQRKDVFEPDVWNRAVASLPGSHLLQSWAWGEAKAEHGWTTIRSLWLVDNDTPAACAQLLFRTTRLGPLQSSVVYCPKGPVLDWSNRAVCDAVLGWIEATAAEVGAIQAKIDPDLEVGRGEPRDHPTGAREESGQEISTWKQRGWRHSPEQVQFKNTLVLSLEPSEEEILASMKQKTRYNVRLASRKGVTVRHGGLEDLDLLYQMYANTSVRDGFVIRSRAYYESVWGRFIRAGLAQPLIAEVEGSPVSAVIPFSFGDTAWYMYGMSLDSHRDKMPTYLLQWEIIRWAKARGCTRYDMWGAPDHFDDSDSLYGVYRFKAGFGAEVVRTVGAWDYPVNRRLYWLYHQLVPRWLAVRRVVGRQQTRLDLDGALEDGDT